MARRLAVLSPFVRIVTGVNDTIRLYDPVPGTGRTVTLTAGTYWFGVNGNLRVPNDSTITGAASFLEHLSIRATATLGESTKFAVSAPTATNLTGYIVATCWTGTEVQFDNAATLVSPLWLGRGKNGTTYGTYTSAGGTEEVVGTFSGLTFVGDVQIGDDRPVVVPLKNEMVADSGAQYFTYFGQHSKRDFTVNLRGVPREDGDSSFHSFRRFWTHLETTGQSFLYFPDWALVDGSWVSTDVYDPDNERERMRYGFERFKIDASVKPDFDPADRFPGYAYHHQVRFRANTYVAT